MLIETHKIEVNISNNAKYYKGKYGDHLKQGMKILVEVKDLPKSSNKLVKFICDDCGDVEERQFQLLNKAFSNFGSHECFKCSHKNRSSRIDYSNTIQATKLRSGEKHPRWNSNKSKLQSYRAKVMSITGKQNLFLLENFDKPRGLCGVEGAYQLDHIVSIKYGFDHDIPAEVIGNLGNLRIIPWKENRTKGYKLSSQAKLNNQK